MTLTILGKLHTLRAKPDKEQDKVVVVLTLQNDVGVDVAHHHMRAGTPYLHQRMDATLETLTGNERVLRTIRAASLTKLQATATDEAEARVVWDLSTVVDLDEMHALFVDLLPVRGEMVRVECKAVQGRLPLEAA